MANIQLDHTKWGNRVIYKLWERASDAFLKNSNVIEISIFSQPGKSAESSTHARNLYVQSQLRVLSSWQMTGLCSTAVPTGFEPSIPVRGRKKPPQAKKNVATNPQWGSGDNTHFPVLFPHDTGRRALTDRTGTLLSAGLACLHAR